MAYTPRFSYTDGIARNLMTIEGARRVIDILPLPPDTDLQLRHEARQRSTHHSTRIEGNPLQETAIQHVVAHPHERRQPPEEEVRNYWRALEWIEVITDRENLRLSEELIKELHALIFPVSLGGRPRKKNEYREGPVAVIDRSGAHTYDPPDWGDVRPLMRDLVEWITAPRADALPVPIRAAIFAYQFVTIHPYMDGNGRTARALATLELWRSGYAMRGFLSMEEYYTRDIMQYYNSLQMGCPVNYYEGRHDPDLTPWLEYFTDIMAQASQVVCERAERLYRVSHPRPYAWERLNRLQQQLLSRSLTLATEGRIPVTFSPAEVADWFGVTTKTAREWLHSWLESDFVKPLGEIRARTWTLGEDWHDLIVRIARPATGEDRQ